jgi:hypothetical protein
MGTRTPLSRLKGSIAADGGISIGNGAWVFSNAGVPSAGTSGTGAGWAGKGSLCTDTTNGKLYINTGTTASPTWTVVGSQS